MTTFDIWFPIVICGLTGALYFVALTIKFFRPKRKYPALKYGILSLTLLSVTVLLLWMFIFLKATPGINWQELTKETDTAILFGFGFEKDTNGDMTPGAANQELYNQAVKNAGTKTLHLIMQEGVMVAARCDVNQYPFKRNLVRMHPHVPGKDVNTLAAAGFAIKEMERLKVKSAVVYAHDMQLARAVYDLKSIAASEPRWKDFRFITPDVGATPFPRKSEQLRTRCKLCYFPWELGARVYESLSLKKGKALPMDDKTHVQQKEESKIPVLLIVIYGVVAFLLLGSVFTEKHDRLFVFLFVLIWPIAIPLVLVGFLLLAWITRNEKMPDLDPYQDMYYPHHERPDVDT